VPDLVDVPDVVPVAVAVAEVVLDDVPIDEPTAVTEACDESEAVDVVNEEKVTDILDDTVVEGVIVGLVD
jgi:hypothetical protein